MDVRREEVRPLPVCCWAIAAAASSVAPLLFCITDPASCWPVCRFCSRSMPLWQSALL